MSKKDVIVAVRMPAGLLERLRDLQQTNHFMDMSDEIRYVIKKYCIFAKDETSQLELRRKEKIVEDLTKVIEELKKQTPSEVRNENI